MSQSDRGRLASLALIAALLTAPLAAAGLPAQSASAAARVTVEAEGGGTTADPDYATRFTVRGEGFQSIPGGFGGIYLMFGTVAGTWQPSAGGLVGRDYRYVPDAESKDNQGFQRFVAFPGSDTADAANAVMGADGSWSVDIVVPGARFESQDRSGAVTEVDCRVSQCGFLTIGAHGVKNSTNETFTPISFASAASASESAPAAAAPAAASGSARVGYTASSARAGQALIFTAQGFAPGELVVASLDEGVAAVGPLTAGASGEVGGVLTLPSDLRAGTHLLEVRGAASSTVAQTDVTIEGAEGQALLPEQAASTDEPAWLPIAVLGGIVVAATLLLSSLLAALLRTVRRVRAARAARGTRSAEAPNSSPSPSPETADSTASPDAEEHRSSDDAAVPSLTEAGR